MQWEGSSTLAIVSVRTSQIALPTRSMATERTCSICDFESRQQSCPAVPDQRAAVAMYRGQHHAAHRTRAGPDLRRRRHARGRTWLRLTASGVARAICALRPRAGYNHRSHLGEDTGCWSRSALRERALRQRPRALLARVWPVVELSRPPRRGDRRSSGNSEPTNAEHAAILAESLHGR